MRLDGCILTWSLSVGNNGFVVMKLPVSRNETLTLADLPKLFQKSLKNVGFTHQRIRHKLLISN